MTTPAHRPDGPPDGPPGETPGEALDARALLTPPGRKVLARIADARDEPELRLATALRREFPAALVAAAMAQRELRTAAAAKFTRADRMLFTRAGLEQASPEPAARHTAARLAAFDRVADLCCGIGGDALALAAGTDVLGVDIDPVHLALAEENCAVYGVSARWRCDDVRSVDLTGVAAAFVDPARRAGGRRFAVGAGEPPLDWCFALVERVAAVAVKAAPALDAAVVPPGWEVEFVALGRELKEAVLWSPALSTATSRATVVDAAGTAHTLVAEPTTGRGSPHPGASGQDSNARAVREPGEYLLDPNPAVTRAGLVTELARILGAAQIDPRIAFLTADEPMATPFGRCLRVLDSGPWHEKRLAARLRELDVGSVDIRRRGLAGDVDQIRRRLKLRGTRRAVLVMTRKDDRPWALVCVPEPGA